jgi:beta-N-acetylhexosaminidase
VVGFQGTRLAAAPWVAEDLGRRGLGGVILFDRDQTSGGVRNVTSPSQVARLCADLQATAGHDIIIAVDQEGGLVTRLSPAYGFPAAVSQSRIGQGTGAGARRWARTIAGTLAEAGINLNLAPVVDLDLNPDNPAIGALGRSFSADPAVVVRMASIECRAHRAARVRTTLKHFPGIGSATGSTDDGTVDVSATWTPLELEPFRRLITGGVADVVMAAHVIDRRLSSNGPTSLSSAVVTGLLRDQLGWDGAVITDDLQAKAIATSYGTEEAAVLALEAGNDLLLIANQQTYDEGVVGRVVDAIAAAVDDGRLTETQVDRAWRRVQDLFRWST